MIISEPIEEARQHRVIEAARDVAVGMTPDEVLDVLGTPTAEYDERGIIARLWMGDRPKQGMFGTKLNLGYRAVPHLPFPNPFPPSLRIAEYADEDLVIDWSHEDRVTRIRRPALDVPKFADDALDAICFVPTVLNMLVVRE